MTDQAITPPEKINQFKSDEHQAHENVAATEKVVVENINAFEYYKGYAAGMNGLIEKVQNKSSLESVVNNVQDLTDQYHAVKNIGGASGQYNKTQYPNIEINEHNLKGKINGIVDGVKTLRDIDITKYVTIPAEVTAKPLPEYPALSKKEAREHREFIETMRKNYPDSSLENLNKLCGIAHEIQQHTRNRFIDNKLTEDKFNTLTDDCEARLREVKKGLPGMGVVLDYEVRGASIKLTLPDGTRNNLGGYAVPEIPIHKLTLSQENKTAITQNIGAVKR